MGHKSGHTLSRNWPRAGCLSGNLNWGRAHFPVLMIVRNTQFLLAEGMRASVFVDFWPGSCPQLLEAIHSVLPHGVSQHGCLLPQSSNVEKLQHNRCDNLMQRNHVYVIMYFLSPLSYSVDYKQVTYNTHIQGKDVTTMPCTPGKGLMWTLLRISSVHKVNKQNQLYF